uniref:Uncharacterized protein n=1 Tax=Brassica oleracea var. oleracea TaxID=109376 RepID=A0A0D3APH9_BRAOL
QGNHRSPLNYTSRAQSSRKYARFKPCFVKNTVDVIKQLKEEEIKGRKRKNPSTTSVGVSSRTRARKVVSDGNEPARETTVVSLSVDSESEDMSVVSSKKIAITDVEQKRVREPQGCFQLAGRLPRILGFWDPIPVSPDTVETTTEFAGDDEEVNYPADAFRASLSGNFNLDLYHVFEMSETNAMGLGQDLDLKSAIGSRLI